MVIPSKELKGAQVLSLSCPLLTPEVILSY